MSIKKRSPRRWFAHLQCRSINMVNEWIGFDLILIWYILSWFFAVTTHIRLIMKPTLCYPEFKLRLITTIFILLMEKEGATVFISSRWASLRTYGTYCQYSCGNWHYRSIGSQFILNTLTWLFLLISKCFFFFFFPLW